MSQINRSLKALKIKQALANEWVTLLNLSAIYLEYDGEIEIEDENGETFTTNVFKSIAMDAGKYLNFFKVRGIDIPLKIMYLNDRNGAIQH